jgi:hypothetical protein
MKDLPIQRLSEKEIESDFLLLESDPKYRKLRKRMGKPNLKSFIKPKSKRAAKKHRTESGYWRIIRPVLGYPLVIYIVFRFLVTKFYKFVGQPALLKLEAVGNILYDTAITK